MPRRRGRPGLVGTMAKTAVVAGTATAVHSSMTGKKQSKQAAADEQAAANQAAADEQAAANQAAFESQAQLAEMQRQQAAAAAAPAGNDMMAELKQLADLKAAGILTDDEFAAAKAKILS